MWRAWTLVGVSRTALHRIVYLAFPLLEVSIIVPSCCVWVCVVVCLWPSCAIFEEGGFVFIRTVLTIIFMGLKSEICNSLKFIYFQLSRATWGGSQQSITRSCYYPNLDVHENIWLLTQSSLASTVPFVHVQDSANTDRQVSALPLGEEEPYFIILPLANVGPWQS